MTKASGADERPERMALAAYQFGQDLGDMARLARRNRYVVDHCTYPMIGYGMPSLDRDDSVTGAAGQQEVCIKSRSAHNSGNPIWPLFPPCGCDRLFPPTNNTVVAGAR
jgi:hypothetical protein